MGSQRPLGVVRAAIATLVASVLALGLLSAPAAAATGAVPPRVGRAMGIVSAIGRPEIAVGVREPAVYHGGSVMHGVHVHTVFWAPPGFPFSGSPSAGVLGYEPLMQQFLSDAAHDSGARTNDFSILAQYGDASGPGSNAITYAPASDSIDDTDPYPAQSNQCASPGGLTVCVTDLEVERELDRVVSAHDPAGRGLHDLWVLLLPPGVDECTQAGVCGTNEFAGYHAEFDLGHGTTIYAVIIDPTIEGVEPQGTDPEGNPDAEAALDTTAHELVEAATDPEGTGWMDPDGGEVGDKCETIDGTPLGYANGSPYSDVLNGHPYLLQTMWSDAAGGCVQSAPPEPAPSDPSVALRQFSAAVSGRSGQPGAGVSVVVGLIRGGGPVALGHTRTRTGGSWSLTLRSIDTGAPMPVGDDRDVLEIQYGRGGPPDELIATDGGGDPFTEAGWTGWFDLDHGYAVGSHGVAVSPCGQTGVLTLQVSGRPAGAFVPACQTETDVAVLPTSHLSAGTALAMTSTDNRASSRDDPLGALVSLTVPLGEPDSVSAVGNDQILLATTGFPTCAADLRAQAVSCRGLVARARYTLDRSGHRLSARADDVGVARFTMPGGAAWLRGGEVLALRNRAGRTLTRLHVAHLRIAIRGTGTAITGGSCEIDDYWGAPVGAPPIGAGVGAPSVGGTGTVCPPNGHAAGLPGAGLEQTDPWSGGLTRTEVPELGFASPAAGATLYGPFIAVGQPALAGAQGAYAVTGTVSLTIARRGGAVVRRLSGLQRPQGALVSGLAAGVYRATWTVADLNGDTRTLSTLFVQEP